MSPSDIERAEKWVILIKTLLPSLIGILAILITYFAYRWKVNADKRAMEDLDPERLRLKMQAVIAERLAARKTESLRGTSPNTKVTEKTLDTKEPPPEDTQEDEILSF